MDFARPVDGPIENGKSLLNLGLAQKVVYWDASSPFLEFFEYGLSDESRGRGFPTLFFSLKLRQVPQLAD